MNSGLPIFQEMNDSSDHWMTPAGMNMTRIIVVKKSMPYRSSSPLTPLPAGLVCFPEVESVIGFKSTISECVFSFEHKDAHTKLYIFACI